MSICLYVTGSSVFCQEKSDTALDSVFRCRVYDVLGGPKMRNLTTGWLGKEAQVNLYGVLFFRPAVKGTVEDMFTYRTIWNLS